MAAGLWQVGLWQKSDQAAYSHGQFRSVFSVKLFVELSEPTATPAVLKSLTQARKQPSGKHRHAASESADTTLSGWGRSAAEKRDELAASHAAIGCRKEF
jgi:hypothetical protein